MPDPTPRQREILALLWREASAGRPVPSIREICSEIGWSAASTAWHHLNDLAKRGLIERGLHEHGRKANRAIRLTDAGHLALGRRTRFTVRGSVG